MHKGGGPPHITEAMPLSKPEERARDMDIAAPKTGHPMSLAEEVIPWTVTAPVHAPPPAMPHFHRVRNNVESHAPAIAGDRMIDGEDQILAGGFLPDGSEIQ